jgi:hypothetical protein
MRIDYLFQVPLKLLGYCDDTEIKLSISGKILPLLISISCKILGYCDVFDLKENLMK